MVNPSLAARCSIQKRNAETDATFKLFVLRMSELGPDWSVNHNEMNVIISSLKDASSTWADGQKQLKGIS